MLGLQQLLQLHDLLIGRKQLQRHVVRLTCLRLRLVLAIVLTGKVFKQELILTIQLVNICRWFLSTFILDKGSQLFDSVVL